MGWLLSFLFWILLVSPLGLILVAITYFFYFLIKKQLSKLESKVNRLLPKEKD